MNYSNYDEYLRSMFGYPDMRMGTGSGMFSCNNFNSQFDDLERMYPETYRIIYPMVCSSCDSISMSMPISEANIDSMVDNIYDRVVADGRISLEYSSELESRDSKEDNKESRQNINVRPRRPNRFLRDLIRILLLRELLRRRPRFPFRPF